MKRAVACCICLITLLSFTQFAFAKEDNPGIGRKLGQTNTSTPAAKLKNNTQRCQNFTLRYKQIVQNYNTRKDIHVAVYRRQLDHWKDLAIRLTNQGLDVTTLRTDLTALETMITKLSTDYATFVTTLESDNENPCDQTAEELKTNLKNSRERLQSFRMDSRKIHNYIRGTIRTDLRNLRQQLSSAKPTPTDE
ncbi:MAG: hypothetical protein ACD_40C00332G0003 [uncultured bacterium]|nr:MAG: hypothetical protein ACD_40C00332G0003 [uncultured bacterium]